MATIKTAYDGTPPKKKKMMNAENLSYHLMLLPGIVILFVFATLPLIGIIMSFQNYVPAKGFFRSEWVGLEHFRRMLEMPDSYQILQNTLIIAISKMILAIIVPVLFSLLLNELRAKSYKRVVQTVVYMPHFLSWVILGGIFISMLSVDGIVNQMLKMFGIEPIMFLGSNTWFRPIIIITDTWKSFGFGTIIYLAALTAVDPNLYEAAAIDGANRFRRCLHVTLPAIVPTIILLSTLSLGNILNAGFDQIYNMYNPIVFKTGDIIDTYVFRMGLESLQFSFGAAVGLLKSLVSALLIFLSYFLARKFSNYRIF